MRFAIIGDHPEAAYLAEAVHRSSEHQLAACCVKDDLAAEMTKRGVAFSIVPSYDEAILTADTDVVVVAIRDVDDSTSSVRRASQEGKHVLAVPPEDVSTAYSFELNLLLDEGTSGIVALTGRWYAVPGWESILSIGAENTQQIRLALPLAEEKSQQTRYQMQAIDAVCGSGMEFSQITGLDLSGSDGNVMSRTVTLASSAQSETTVPPATITFDKHPHSETEIVLTASDGEDVRLPFTLPSPTATPSDRGDVMLQRLVDQFRDKSGCQTGMEEFSNTLELCQGLEKSLRRRRTVDVYFDGVSERAVFKTQMTAIGCGVLTYVIFGMLAFLIVAQVFSPPPLLLQIGRVLWIAPVVVFLMAQFLLPLTRDRATRRDSGPNSDRSQ